VGERRLWRIIARERLNPETSGGSGDEE